MSDDDIHQPHDKLFKAGFSDPVNAAAFLRTQIPDAVSKQVNWGELRLESTHFIDSQFRKSESDLLFTAPFGESNCFIYLLFEHQRERDPWIALRLLRYMLRIWEKSLESKTVGDRLPVILPVVIAQSSGAWKTSTRFLDLLDVPSELAEDLQGCLPDFSFRLIELLEIPFDQIIGTPDGIFILRVLKAEITEDLMHQAVWDESITQRVTTKILEYVLTYIYNRGSDKDQFYQRIDSIQDPKLKQSAMTLADQFRQEGRHEGRQEGVLAGQIRAFQEVIGESPTPEDVLLSLPLTELQELVENTRSRLGRIPPGS